MFLGQFRRRVHVPRIRRRALTDQARRELGSAVGAAGLETPCAEVFGPPWPGAYRSVPLAGVPALSVDHHRPGEDQLPDPGRGHLRQQHRRPEVVAADVLGGVREVLAQADHRRLVAHRVHPAQRRPYRTGVPYVGPDELPIGQRRSVRVGGGEQGVEDEGVVPAGTEGGDDVGADEPGSSGDEYAHAPDATQCGSSWGSATRARKTSVMRSGPPRAAGRPYPRVGSGAAVRDSGSACHETSGTRGGACSRRRGG